jgi:hypothetical protein
MNKAYATTIILLMLALGSWAAAVVALRVGAPPTCPLGDDSDLTCARGFQGRERAEGVAFRWTDGDSALRFSGLGYGGPHALSLRMWSGRPEATPVEVVVTSGGKALPFVVAAAPRRYTFLVPQSALGGDELRVRVHSATFAPGSGRRALGVSMADARMLPLPHKRWPGPLLVLSLCALALIPLARPLGQAAALPPAVAPLWLLSAALALLASSVLVAFAPSRAVPYLPAFAVMLALARLLGWLRPNPLLAVALLLGVLELVLVRLGDGPAWRAPLLLAVQALLVLLACRWLLVSANTQSVAWSVAPTALIGAALLLRLLGVGLRLLTGDTYLDGDVELFYAYGMALKQVGLPTAEYPSGAIVVWSLLATLAGESRERFALLLPLLNTLCDLGIVACIALIGRRLGQTAIGAAAAACYALSPALLPFVLAKYDALPTLLLVGGLAAFVYAQTIDASRHTLHQTAQLRLATLSACQLVTLSGCLLGLGGAIKWAPLLAAPLLGLYLLRMQAWRALVALCAGCVVGLGVVSLPFVLRDLDAFLMPYRLQGGRGMTGQSIWFLVALPFDRDLLAELPKAWSAVRGGPPVALMVVGQATALLLAALGVLRHPTLTRAVTLAALAPTLFLLLNRVYSPQYMVTISAALLLGIALLAPPRRVVPLLTLLLVAQAANLLIWPLFSAYWLLASGLMFGAALGVCAALLVPAQRYQHNNRQHQRQRGRQGLGSAEGDQGPQETQHTQPTAAPVVEQPKL